MSDCVMGCGTKNAFKDGGWVCLPAYGTTLPACVCQACTTLLGFAWAKEMKRQRDFPGGNSPTPTSPPSGDATPAELSLQAVAA